MANYKCVPFVAKISGNASSSDAAGQVENFIQQHVGEGWEFVSCGNIDTEIAGSNGCFGFGAKPGSSTSILVLIFKK